MLKTRTVEQQYVSCDYCGATIDDDDGKHTIIDSPAVTCHLCDEKCFWLFIASLKHHHIMDFQLMAEFQLSVGGS